MKFWKKLRKSALSLNGRTGKVEGFLREREAFCVNAVSRLTSGMLSQAWAAQVPCPDAAGPAAEPAVKPESGICGLLLYGKRLLFPVFHFPPAMAEEFRREGLPLPSLFPLVLKNDPLHSAQGLAADMDALEAALEKKGISPSSKYEYELRGLDYSESPALLSKSTGNLDGPPGLVVRRAETADAAALFPLQAAYEQEEVLPRGAAFDPGLCRRGLEYVLAGNLILTAEFEDRLVGKININARSFNFFQIGGVYVLPKYRCLGIARAMTAAIIREFAPLKNRFTLFVKKTNAPALRVYDSLGFQKTGGYRISYF